MNHRSRTSHWSTSSFIGVKIYRPFPHPWATLTDGGPPFFPAAWPAQLCHQGSKSLLPRQMAYCLRNASGRHWAFLKGHSSLEMTWPLDRIFSGYISAAMIFSMGILKTISWLKLQFKNALLLRQEKFMELYWIFSKIYAKFFFFFLNFPYKWLHCSSIVLT